MRCGKCLFFEQFDEENEIEIGTCKRFPPVLRPENVALRGCFDSDPVAHSPREWSQPTVEEYDRCGEYKPVKKSPT